MESLRTLSVDRTHLFPGARLVLDGPEPSERIDVVILFSDGAHAEAVLTPLDEGLALQVEEHRTVAGTDIPAKDWELSRGPDGGLRVARRTTQ